MLIFILIPFTYPLAKFLDWLLGTHHKTRFEKNELKTLFELHEFKKEGKEIQHGLNKVIRKIEKFNLN